MAVSNADGNALISTGAILYNRFEIGTVLGRGGSATVYRAHDRTLDRAVAVKVLDNAASSLIDAERFEREIRLTARLVHPGIVPLFDSGTTGGQRFYVMPCIIGMTLRHRIETAERSDTLSALRLIGDVAEALAYAHSMGVVHRDIKPENIFCSDGRALVADFGIARAIAGNAANMTLTETGHAIGTVSYMSPEQAVGDEQVDTRTDLYALGCVLIELLAGHPPFTGDSAMAILAQHITSDPQVAALLCDQPQSLITLVTRLLAKHAGDRPASAAGVVDSLREIAEDLRSGNKTVVKPETPRVASETTLTESERLSAEARALFSRSVQGGPTARGMLDIALVYAQKSVALEPTNARALSNLADITHLRGFRGFADEASSFAESQQLRLRALALDDSIGELHSSLGVMALYWEDDFHRAGTHLRRAAELAPQDSSVRRHLGCWFKMAGQFDAALEEMRVAAEISPDAPHVKVGLADALMAVGRYVEAIVPLQAALQQNANYAQATERLEMACHRCGRVDDAFAARRTMLGTHRQLDRLAKLSAAMESDGWEIARAQDLRAEIADLLSRAESEDPFRDPQGSRQLSDRLIITYGELGEWRNAMDWVERGYYLQPGRLIRVLTDLPFDRRGLAVDPRYARLLRTAGLDTLL